MFYTISTASTLTIIMDEASNGRVRKVIPRFSKLFNLTRADGELAFITEARGHKQSSLQRAAERRHKTRESLSVGCDESCFVQPTKLSLEEACSLLSSTKANRSQGRGAKPRAGWREPFGSLAAERIPSAQHLDAGGRRYRVPSVSAEDGHPEGANGRPEREFGELT